MRAWIITFTTQYCNSTISELSHIPKSDNGQLVTVIDIVPLILDPHCSLVFFNEIVLYKIGRSLGTCIEYLNSSKIEFKTRFTS